jgi:hypothetical protein
VSKRRALTTYVIAAACSVILYGCGGSTTTIVKTSSSETTTVSTVTERAPAHDPAKGSDRPSESTPRPVTAFQTPSGNIGCGISPRSVACVITTADWVPDGNPGCPSDAGRFVQFSGDVPDVRCGTPDGPLGQTLGYDTKIRSGGFTCASLVSGLTCTNGGHGFTMSQDGFAAR